MIYTVTLNPALDKTVVVPGFALDTVNRIVSVRTDPGGKGINVSKVIAKLGGASVAMGILAGAAGRAIAAQLEQQGLTCDFCFAGSGETRTNLKVVDPQGRTHTDINEPGPAVGPRVMEELLGRLTGRLAAGDIVVQAGAKVFLDADGSLLADGIQAAPYLVKPNQDELSRLAGRPLETVDQLRQAGAALLDAGIRKVVVSLGSRGGLYMTREQTILAEGLPVKVGSTVGAGDSVVAALACAEDRGLSLEEAVVLSTAAGAANVMCSGTQAAEYSVVQSLMPRVVWRAL